MVAGDDRYGVDDDGEEMMESNQANLHDSELEFACFSSLSQNFF